MTEKILYQIGLSDVTLLDIIQLYKKKLKDAIALLYSPQSCYFARLQETNDLGKLMIFDSEKTNREIDLVLNYQKSYIFEARIFNEHYELRWLNDYNGKGKAVLLSEVPLSNDSGIDQEFSSSLEPYDQSSGLFKFIDTIPQQYLIWGEKIDDKSLDNWVTVSTARIGSLNIPFNKDLDKNKRIYLKTLEYFKEVDECGNVSVIEERLVNLEVQ
ncbi:MAG: CRISPR-associated protein Csx19 [Crocosphaera sp.]|nr:CRISPR-associated protein Csx19 [Crocosphaera sp.]